MTEYDTFVKHICDDVKQLAELSEQHELDVIADVIKALK